MGKHGRIQDLQKEGAKCRNGGGGEIVWYSPKTG